MVRRPNMASTSITQKPQLTSIFTVPISQKWISVAHRLWTGQPNNCGLSPERGKRFFSLLSVTLAMGTTHPAVQWVILAFPLACNGWGMKLIIHFHIAPADIRGAGIALLILKLSRRCKQGGVVSFTT